MAKESHEILFQRRIGLDLFVWWLHRGGLHRRGIWIELARYHAGSEFKSMKVGRNHA